MNRLRPFRHLSSRGILRSRSLVFVLLLLLTLFVAIITVPVSSSTTENNDSSNNNNNDDNMTQTYTALTVLVVGATGATGKHVVHQLLQKGHTVKTIVRSKQRMLDTLEPIDESNTKMEQPYSNYRLFIKEASLLDLTDDELSKQMEGVDAVVSCLGHNMDFKGLFGQPRRLVTDATQRLTTALQKEASNEKKKARFVLMGSDGVANPAGTDDIRPFSERLVLAIIRLLIPPHRDNEAAAQYLYDAYPASNDAALEWIAVRPTDLIDENADDGSMNDKYTLTAKPRGSLFGSGNIATRSNVARSMVDLLTNDALWTEWKFQMPCMCDDVPESSSSAPGKQNEL